MLARMLYRDLQRQLTDAGIEAARFESGALFTHFTGIKPAELLCRPETSCTQQQAKRLDGAAKRRCSGVPLQYILGSWDFYGRDFLVGEGVLIPRADTEVLIGAVCSLYEPQAALAIADLCAGTGCIGITLALHYKNAQVTAVEKSPGAFFYLQQNIALHQTENVRAIEADVLTMPLPAQRFDLIVSNPPYIATRALERLQREVLCEPRMALDGGQDGLDFYRALTARYTQCLKEGGYLAFEIGYDQAEPVESLLTAAGGTEVTLHRDTGTNARVVCARFGCARQPLGCRAQL